MIRLTSCLIATAIVFSSFASVATAVAAAPKKTPEERFSKIDKNGDGKLSLDEFVGKKTDDKKDKATKRFKKLDKDGDSALTLDEFKAGNKPKA